MEMQMRGGRACRRGRPIANVKLMEQMSAIQAIMESMDLAWQRERDLGDDSESNVEGGDQEEDATLEIAEMKLLRSVLGSSSRPKPSLSTYDGNSSVEGMIEWIGELN